jgi:hypothetical protein
MKAKMKLIVREGPQAESEYPLDAEVIRLGREAARTIPFSDVQVSRQHAEITCQEETADPQPWAIRDVGSANGTFVNGQRVEGERPLQPGDQIRLGNTLLSYEAVEANRRFHNGVAILIALSTLVGALLAWQISLILDNADTADIEGMTAWVRLTQVRTDVYSSLAINQQAFAEYNWQWVTAARLAQERDAALQRGDEVLAAELEAERLAYAQRASNSLNYVDRDYVPSIGSASGDLFERDRFLAANEAERTSRQDVDYETHFHTADQLRFTAQALTLMTILLAASVFCYTAAQLSQTRRRYALAVAGGLLFVVGTFSALFIRVAGGFFYNLFF